MTDYTLFLSYASADLTAAQNLEAWLEAPPNSYRVWRDRRGIAPAAPNYYEPIAEGIGAAANFLVLLSPRWLRSRVSAQEISDAHAAGKKLVPVVHPLVARDPSTAAGRAAKAELFEALDAAPARRLLEPINWIWLVETEGAPPDYAPIHTALATDFEWKRQHSVIVQRLARWESMRDASALLRGTELAELASAAFTLDENREPTLTEAQREFLLASQRHDAAERERAEALYTGAQARSLAFAARDRAEAEPDTALLLAAEAARVAAVPEARAALGLVLDRHARLLRVDHAHGRGRTVTGLAFSADGLWLASTDRANAINDQRVARVRIHDAASGRELAGVPSDRALTAVAWGERWIAVASSGSIGWLRWDEDRERFRSNTPIALGDDVAPDFLAFSPTTAARDRGELLAWGVRYGDLGVIRVGDHARLRGRVSGQASSDALAGVAWLADGRLLTAEAGRIVVRDPSTLEERCTIATTRRVFSLACVGDRWVASCVTDDGAGLLMGAADRVERFMRVGLVDVGSIAAWAGHASDAEVLVGSTSARSGVPMVALATPAPYVGTPDVLLEGEDFPVSALAADAKGRFVAAGDTNGRVWVWDRARSSALLRTGGESEASIAGPQPEPRFHYAFETAAGSLFRSWHRRPAGVAGAEAEEIYSPQDELFSQLARVGDEYLVISDGDDLVFMPVDEPARFTRRTAHDNPVKHLAAGATVVVSAACSFADTRIDVLMFWNPEGEPLGRVALPAHAMRIEIAAEERSIHVTDEYGRLWTVPLAIDEWAAVARIIAGRPLTDEEIRRYRIDSRRDVGSGA